MTNPTNKRTGVRKSIYLFPADNARLKRIAKHDGRTESEQVRWLISQREEQIKRGKP